MNLYQLKHKLSGQKGCTNPDFNDALKFCGHQFSEQDGLYQMRTDKLKDIIKFSNDTKIKAKLIVCFSESGENCCKCKKCVRTQLNLLVLDENPSNWGFEKFKPSNLLNSMRELNYVERDKESIFDLQHHIDTNKKYKIMNEFIHDFKNQYTDRSYNKLVSIITPSFNSGKYIHRLLGGILKQTHPKVEMFVIDDGSDDNSAEIVKSFIPRFKKKGYKLEYVYQKNQGQSVAINNGLKLVKGDYLVWPDSDDYYASRNAISEMAYALELSDKATSMVRVEYNILNENYEITNRIGVNDETRYKTDLFEDAIFASNGFWYPPGGYMAKMSKVDELIPNREIYTDKSAGQNFQIYLPLLYKHKCVTIEKHLYNVVEHEDSHSRNTKTNNRRQRAYYLTIANTLNKMTLPSDYRNYLIREVKRMTKNAKTTRRIGDYRVWTKRIVKGIIPHGVIVLLRNKGILNTPEAQLLSQEPDKSELDKLSDYDDWIYEQGFAHNDLNQANIEGWMLFCAHVLEKAMSRENFEAGHNIFRLEQLRDLLKDYDNKEFDKKSFAYRYALSSIKEYILLHEKNGFSTDKIKSILGNRYDEALDIDEVLAGYKVINKAEKTNNKKISFAELQTNRFSVREFSDKKVNPEDIRSAIELSVKAPSVCNRQPVRVYNVANKDKIEQILTIQRGFHGYATPPNLLLITADVRNYVDVNERNQGFIDGGSFAMSLLLSLEYYGLAACPLHAMLSPESDQKMKEILGITNPEYLVMFIAVGYFNDNNKVAVSSRYNGYDITKEYF